VNGRVVETLQTVYDLGPVDNPSIKYGSFQCTFTADWNYWLQAKNMRCGESVDDQLDDTLKELAEFMCDRTCQFQLRSYQDAYPRCQDLEAGADSGNEFFIWLERAVCTGGKAVMSMLVLSMFAATVGMFMCYFCANKPQLIMIPGILIVLLTAIAVVAYGASISSTFPFTLMARDDIIIEEAPQVDGAQSNAANVQIGFGLAIAGAVLSLVSVTLAYIGRYLPSDGTELQVVSAMPIQIYGNADSSAQDPSAPSNVLEAIALAQQNGGNSTPNNAPTIATASVVTTPDMGNANSAAATPFADSRVVAVSQSPRVMQLAFPGEEGGSPTPGAGESSLGGGGLEPGMVSISYAAGLDANTSPSAPSLSQVQM